MWSTYVPILCLLASPAEYDRDFVKLQVEMPVTEISRTSPVIRTEIAPHTDGSVRHMEVPVREGAKYFAIISAIHDNDCPTEQFLVTPYYKYDFLGLLWPNRDVRPIIAMSASQGFNPEQTSTPMAQVFKLDLEPHSMITFVIQLQSNHLPEMILWKRDAFYQNEFDRLVTFYRVSFSALGAMIVIVAIPCFYRARKHKLSISRKNESDCH